MHAGQVIERYTVDALIGSGGIASVYRVRHNQLGSVHALKVLAVASANVRQRLIQEGQAQANLRHPNVVSVTDVIDVEGEPGLVMEYVDGPSLHGWLRENRPNLVTALNMFMGIVRGVRHAHRKGLIHRDLKPGNVLLEHGDDAFTPKVADFGLVKVLQTGKSGGTLEGSAMGTPEYMAPEQIADAAQVDQRADMFSLGCILYQLVCGVPPFSGSSHFDIYNAVSSGDFTPPEQRKSGLPEPVLRAIKGLLETDRDERIPDCDRLLDVLCSDFVPGTSGAQSGWNWATPIQGNPQFAGPATPQTVPPPPTSPTPQTPAAGAGTRWNGPAPDVATPDVAPSRGFTPNAGGLALVGVTGLALILALMSVFTSRVLGEPKAAAETPAVIVEGSIDWTGDATKVQLRSELGELLDAEGSVPVGDYTILAWFEGDKPTPAGRVAITADAPVKLNCDASTLNCAVE